MSILLKKFKNSNLSMKLVYCFILITYTFSYGWLFYNLVKLSGIETLIRIIVLTVLGLFLVLYAFIGLIMLITNKKVPIVIMSIFLEILAVISCVGGFLIYDAYGKIDRINKADSMILYTTNLVTMNKTEFKNDASFKVGIINNETDVEGNKLAYELIKDKDLKISLEKYETYFEMLEKLYDGEINGIFITSNYVTMYRGYEAYENIEDDLKVVYEYSKEMKNQDYIESKGSVEKPFTVLLMGVDSQKDGLKANASFNGDTLMVIAFNPKTLSTTVFSIPRDTYVPIACIKGSSKINSSAAYGSQCVIKTIENLIGIDIDYYVKINFRGVIDLVDALGGVEVTVPEKVKFCESDENRSTKKENLICINPGTQTMTGKQALAFARHRKTLPAGDFQRVQHQQLVVEGIANSAKKLSNINDFYAVLDAISRNMDTNMTTSEMMNLYNVGKSALFNNKNGSMINIQKTYLTGYDLTMIVSNMKSRVYTFQYYPQSLEEIVRALKETLELEKPEIIKTFNFSINDEYEIPVIGKKYYSVQRNETIPDFTGKTLQYVKEWCSSRNITVNVTNVTKGMSDYSEQYEDGYVLDQTVRRGMLVSSTSSIGISAIKKSSTVIVSTTTTTKPVTTTTTTTAAPVEEPEPNNEPVEEQPTEEEGN